MVSVSHMLEKLFAKLSLGPYVRKCQTCTLKTWKLVLFWYEFKHGELGIKSFSKKILNNYVFWVKATLSFKKNMSTCSFEKRQTWNDAH